MAERAFTTQHTEPTKIVQLFPETPTPIWRHPNYQPQEPTPWQVPKDFEGIMAFNPRHYIQAYLDLRTIKTKIPPAEYQVRLEQQNRLTLHDLQKTILERLVARNSTIKYHINENGRLISEDFAQPALERYEKGQRWLEENGSNEVEREKAEVAGMYKVEALLASGQDMIIVVASARSEGCKHGEEENPKDEPEDILYHQQYVNVYEQKSGVITMTQVHSMHDYEGLLSALGQIDPAYPKLTANESKPAFMLANSAVSVLSAEEVSQKLSIDLRTKPTEECDEVLAACTPIFLSFINTLANNPLDIIQIKKTVNTMYNLADETEEKIKKRKLQQAKTIAKSSIKVGPFRDFSLVRTDLVPNIPAAMSAGQLIEKYGYQQAKTKGGACPGKQKGFNISLKGSLEQLAKKLGANSVADFAKMLDDDEDEDVTDFDCGGTMPDGSPCTYVVRAYSGVSICPQCGNQGECA